MKQTRILMDMPITVEIVDAAVKRESIDRVFDYFISIDNRFSIFKKESEISRFNRGEIKFGDLSGEMKEVFEKAEETKRATNGYFEIKRKDGQIDPSGLVKGWAVFNAAKLVEKMGFGNYFVDAGGDIQVKGNNSKGKPWKIGIRNPFNREENIKVVAIGDKGVATSGTYIRGQHVIDPFAPDKEIKEIVSLTVIGPNIYEADRMATAAFAMRDGGVVFISTLRDFEAYSVDAMGMAIFTPGFEKYVVKSN